MCDTCPMVFAEVACWRNLCNLSAILPQWQTYLRVRMKIEWRSRSEADCTLTIFVWHKCVERVRVSPCERERRLSSVLRSEFWMWIVIGVSYGVGASVTGSIIDGKWSTFGTRFLRETISMIIACIFMRICIRMIELKPCLSACGNEVLPIFIFTLGFGLSSATCTIIFEGKWDYLKDVILYISHRVSSLYFSFVYRCVNNRRVNSRSRNRATTLCWSRRRRWIKFSVLINAMASPCIIQTPASIFKRRHTHEL